MRTPIKEVDLRNEDAYRARKFATEFASLKIWLNVEETEFNRGTATEIVDWLLHGQVSNRPVLIESTKDLESVSMSTENNP